MNNSLTNHQLHRVVTMLNREEVDFLDKLSKDAQFESGARLSRTQILRSLVEACMNLNIDSCDISSEQVLITKIKKLIDGGAG